MEKSRVFVLKLVNIVNSDKDRYGGDREEQRNEEKSKGTEMCEREAGRGRM
jgi:hypothetical protein